MQEKGQKISPIKQRILQFIEAIGISKREFYAKVGISRGTLESKSGITEDIVAKFIASYPEVNVQWLITGVGFMFNEADNSQKAQSASTQVEGIPLVPIEAAAGLFQGEESVLLSDCVRYHVPLFSDAEFLIPIKGDSMQPYYNSGDIVACKNTSPTSVFFQWGKVYVVDTEQGVLIKRVFEGKSKNTIILSSDNKKYPDIEIPREEVCHIAIVLGTLRIE